MSAREQGPMAPDEVKPRRPGEAVVVMTGLIVGLVMMGLQLWLLTLAFDLYLSGERGATLLAAGCSGLIFLGGLLVLWLVMGRGRR
jgi:hypothetical protein